VTGKPFMARHRSPLSMPSTDQAAFLSVQRRRAACPDTPKATAIWSQDLPRQRATSTA